MASFIAKQLVGKQMESVKGKMTGGDETSAEDAERLAEQRAAIAEALAEEKRKREEKHRRMEAEREEMRQGIREKHFGDGDEHFFGGAAGRLGRKRKTAEELAAERDPAEDNLASFLPEGVVRDTVRSVAGVPQRVLADAQDKCAIQ
uniref:Complexin-1 n=1 Tax=Macrostomum lignano TaxID=282301 RepID=A0A1I8GBF8_9PLAT